MNQPAPRRRSSPLARYGPLIAIVVVVAVIATITILNRGKNDTPSTTASADASAVDTDKLPVTYAEAQQRGLKLDFGAQCDETTGKLQMPTLSAPPCVPVFSGDNGGATSPGVTADTIKVAVYVPQPNGDITALLQGILEERPLVDQTIRDYTDMLNQTMETYGRKVELVTLDASGAPEDEVAARNDAVKAADMGVFAVLGGPALNNAFSDELASRGVECISCGLVAPDSVYQKNAPFMWGQAATPEEFMINVGDYITNRLVGRNAEHAGDPEMQTKPRVFGSVHLELDPPVFADVERVVLERGRERGFESAVNETYLFDLGRAAERAPTIVAHLKDAGVSTVIFLGDPLMLIYLTKAATEQKYFPEWIVTGTGYTDTTVLGRLLDQQQWAHAFGLSTLPVRMPREARDAWTLHEWWFGTPPPAETTAPLYLADLSILFGGIHMAGPHLNPQTFAAGLERLPAVGGGPSYPHVSFGRNGLFTAIDGTNRFDYLGVDDMTEIWWDADAIATDEAGKEGQGVWRYSDGGKRYLPGEIPSEPPHAFVQEGSVIEFTPDQVPVSDRPPSYPPWPGSPTAG